MLQDIKKNSEKSEIKEEEVLDNPVLVDSDQFQIVNN